MTRRGATDPRDDGSTFLLRHGWEPWSKPVLLAPCGCKRVSAKPGVMLTECENGQPSPNCTRKPRTAA